MNSYTLVPSSGGVTVAFRLNSDFIKSVKTAKSSPKLVVRDGQVSIRLSPTQEYPCSSQLENSPMEIYDKNHFLGSVTSKLTVITDKKLIRDHIRRPQTTVLPSPTLPQRPASALPAVRQQRPKNYAPYVILADASGSNSSSDIIATLMAFFSLCPATRDELERQLRAPAKVVDGFIANYTQPYNPADVFTGGDVFAYNAVKAHDHFVLKDRAYKELRPWQWNYSDDERQFVLKNTHNALTRLGFLETHPLRRKICDQPQEGEIVPKKLALGGGLLTSKSPNRPVSASPLKRRSDVSSSDDDERRKRKKSDTECTSPSSIDDSGDDDDRATKRTQYYANLAIKFRAKYQEYERLYSTLKTHPKRNNGDKKDLSRLFEMHSTLAEWKKKLWDFDNESRTKSDIMAMAKHKKEKKKPAKKPLDY